MKRIECTVFAFVIGSLCLSWVATGSSDSRKIDGTHPTVTVHVCKSGFLSAFGHKHETQAPIQSGEVKDSRTPSVGLRVDARQLQVLYPEASEGTRAKIRGRVAASLADQNYRLFSACLGLASAEMSSSIFSSSLTFTVPPATVTGVMAKSRCFNMTSPR